MNHARILGEWIAFAQAGGHDSSGESPRERFLSAPHVPAVPDPGLCLQSFGKENKSHGNVQQRADCKLEGTTIKFKQEGSPKALIGGDYAGVKSIVI